MREATTVIGQKLGAYEVVAKLGEGGMGEVYRARDARLGRDVAVKVLPDHLRTDPAALARFAREARAIGALSHPNIVNVFDVGNQDGLSYVVMELLEGETLRTRLTAPLPTRKALEVALQIANGLAAAHAKDIVHRDLKPENVFLTGDGRVKLLDFGLARPPLAADNGDAQTSAGATTLAHTSGGVVVGTVGYMAPEQVRAQPVDHRADIFTFGAVLFEMVTGRRAFRGDSAVETMHAVLKIDPFERPGAVLNVARPVERLIRHCLEKQPDERFQSARDLAFHLQALLQSTSSAGSLAAIGDDDRPGVTRFERIALAGAAVLAMAAAAFALWAGRSTSAAPEPIVRFSIAAPQGRGFSYQAGSLALSPDGRMLAFVAPNTLARATLWVRPLDSLDAREIQIDVNAPSWAAASPSWSPDGKQLVLTAGTSAGGALRRIDLAGGPVLTLADWGSSAIWGNAGVVVFTGRDGGLYRVNAAGAGTPARITNIEAGTGESRHVASSFLPDGRRFLFNAQHPDAGKSALYVGSVDGDARVLVPGITVPAQHADGYLWYQQDGTLFARPFDPARATTTGDAIPVAENIDTFAVSTRTLVTNPRDVGGRTMAWFDASGKTTDVGPAGAYQGAGKPDLSPDGTKLTFARRDGSGNLDIWILEIERNVPQRLTTHAAEEFSPVFSHDGTRVIFGSNRGGAWGLYQRAIDGSGAEELLYESPPRKVPTGVSPDGAVLLFGQTRPETGADLWALPLVAVDGKRTPVPVSVTESLDGFGVFSPDGKWIAYCGGDGAEGDQIYVVPWPVTGSRKRLSSSFGSSPRWSASGREVFFATPDGTIMRVEVSTANGVVEAGVPAPWLKLPSLFAHLAFVPDRAATRALGPIGLHSTTQSLTVTVNWRALVAK